LLVAGGTVLVGRRRQWAWLQAGRARATPGRELVRISSQALTAQASLHAVRWNGEELLLACTPQQVTLLARRPAVAAGGDAA
jgi:flagellar biogenesis protein FliO